MGEDRPTYLIENENLTAGIHLESLVDGLEDDVSCRQPCVGVIV